MLPPYVSAAIERQFEGVSRRQIAHAAAALSSRYRDEMPGPDGFISDLQDALAYLAARMPATHGAISRALATLVASDPSLQPETMLDLGAGPATAAIAAATRWPSIERIRLLEPDATMRSLGGQLIATAPVAELRNARWIQADLGQVAEQEPADLVTACYVLSELGSGAALETVAAAWKLAKKALVVVEPGTMAGFHLVKAIRAHLIELGAHVVGPCPHDGPCPMQRGDWCHFTERIARSRLHREIKGGTVGFEDEPYSYIAVTRTATPGASSRVLRAPRITKSSVELTLCTVDGIERRTVPRGERVAYRAARRLRWGSTL